MYNILIVFSVMYTLQNKNIKCRIYEDDYETSVYDFTNNIRRKDLLTNITNYYSHIDE